MQTYLIFSVSLNVALFSTVYLSQASDTPNNIQISIGNDDFMVHSNLSKSAKAHSGRHCPDNWKEIERHQQQPTENSSCPGVTRCENCCPLGREKDDNGCLVCSCKKSGLFGGDIIITDRVYDSFFTRYGFTPKKPQREKRAALRRNLNQWPKKRGESNVFVPYVFHHSISSGKRRRIRQAMQAFTRETCIRFVPRTNQRDYVEFHGTGSCASFIGRIGGGQRVSLGPDCNLIGTMAHEMMHALGWAHENSRADRDAHIRVLWDNIIEEEKGNFAKLSRRISDDYDSPYDFESIMHYGSYYFSRNGKPTIVDKGGWTITSKTQRLYFSDDDIVQMNRKYRCQNHATPTASTEARKLVTTRPRTTRPRTTTPGTTRPRTRPRTTRKPATTTRRTITTTKYTRTPPTSVVQCRDKHKSCPKWAKNGHCTQAKYVKYMRVACRNSCKLCGGNGVPSTTTAVPTTTTTTTVMRTNVPRITSRRTTRKTSPAPCVDLAKHCEYWAGLNHCKHPKYEVFMARKCRRSCELCTESYHETTRTTTTLRPTTTTHSPSTEASYVIRPRTAIDKQSSTAATVNPSCFDKYETCKHWSENQNCNKPAHRLFMKHACRRSCHLCDS